MVAVWVDLLNAVQQVLQGLGLTFTPPGGAAAVALPAGQVYVREWPDDFNVVQPCLMVTPYGQERLEGGDFQGTEVIYPVLLTHSTVADQSRTLNVDMPLWRQLILDALVEFESTLRPLVRSANVEAVGIDFQPQIDRGKYQNQNLAVGGMLLEIDTRRLRQRATRGN